MGILRNDTDDLSFTLNTRNLVGRGMTCGIQLTNPRVSGEHASLAWTGEQWALKDLGSTNGTFLGGRRLTGGERVLLGADTRFGLGRDDDGWRLTHAGPPAAVATDLSGEVVIEGSPSVLLLPSAERASLSITWTAAGYWRAEPLDGAPIKPWQVDDGELVQAGGVAWRLHLPRPLAPTAIADLLRLEFVVSRDEAHVEITVIQGEARQALEPRTYSQLLLTLARGRLADASLPSLEQGWIHQDDLAERLGLDPSTVSARVFRARQHLDQLGFAADALVERRADAGQLRLGTGNIDITQA